MGHEPQWELGVGYLLDAQQVSVDAKRDILQILRDSGTMHRGFPGQELSRSPCSYNYFYISSNIFCFLEKNVGIIHSFPFGFVFGIFPPVIAEGVPLSSTLFSLPSPHGQVAVV